MKLHFRRDVAFGGCLRAKRRLIYFTSFSVFLGGYFSALPASCAFQALPIRLILSVYGLLTIYSWVQRCMRAEGIISLSISFAAYFLRMTVLLMFSTIDTAQSLLLSEKFFSLFSLLFATDAIRYLFICIGCFENSLLCMMQAKED